MDIERERGITIKAQTVRLDYKAPRTARTYILNLMDTPGHVDFAYEVSRSLAACEGALLVVDASQGVEAQTLANVYQRSSTATRSCRCSTRSTCRRRARAGQAADRGRDRPRRLDAVLSAKTGLGIDEVLEAIVTPPAAAEGRPRRAAEGAAGRQLVRPYLGVVMLVRVVDGVIKKGQRIRMMGTTGAAYDVDRVGVFTPKMTQVDELGPGEIGFITASIKEVADTRVGDTITDDRKPVAEPLPGFKPVQPVVFCGLFPVDAASSRSCATRWASCASTTPASATRWRPAPRSASASAAASSACCTRDHPGAAEREFDLDLIATAPSVIYKMKLTRRHEIEIHNPGDMPDPMKIERSRSRGSRRPS
jgi:GTP-binding protein LepA